MATSREDFKNLGLASLGAVLEYFDFQVYVFVASAIGLAFFPPGTSIWLAQVQAFGIYAIGYLVRPVAGIIIAHFADRIGRKRMFLFTVLLMSIPTLLMGLLPTFGQIGYLAPISLLILRILQGCAVGGELPAATVFVSEHAPWRRLGLFSSVFQAVTNCGLLLGAGVAAVAAVIAASDPAYASLAWRLPFITGGLMGLLAAYLRRTLSETPMFEKLRAERKLSHAVPLGVVLREFRGQCVFILVMVFAFSSTSGVFFQFMPTYLIGQMHIPRTTVLTASTIGTVCFVAAIPLWGMLHDRFGWNRTLAASVVPAAGAAIWYFHILSTLPPSGQGLIAVYALVGVCIGCLHAMIPGLMAALFPTAIRQSGVAFPYSVGTAVFTGLTPLALAFLAGSYGLGAPLAQYLFACAIALGLAAFVNRLPRYLGEPTDSADGEVAVFTEPRATRPAPL